MNEQPPVNNPVSPAPAPAPETPEGKSSSVALIIIVILALLIVAGIVYYFFKLRQPAAVTPLPAVQQTQPASSEPVTPAATTPAETSGTETAPQTPAAQSGSGNQVDFNFEVKQLDNQANSVNSGDFSDNDVSNAAIGL